MTKKIFTKLMSVWLCSLLIFSSGCARTHPAAPQSEKNQVPPKPAISQKMAMVLGPEPNTLDPAKVLLPVESTIVNQIFEGLVRVNAQGELEPGMAKEWQTSSDGKKITFKLRTAQWSNGEAITAKDFAYAWQRLKNSKTGSPYQYLLDPVLSIKAKTNTLLEVGLKHPAPYFVYLTSLPALMPVQQKVIQAAPDFWAKQESTLVTNGPFRLKEWKHSDKIELERNPNYWDQANVKLTHLSLFLTQDQQKMADLYQQGQIDLAAGVAFPNGPMEAEEVNSIGVAETSFLLVNTTKLKDARLRKALALAIDREALTKINRQQPARAFVPPGLKNIATGKDFRLEGGDYFPPSSPAEAARLLADSGYPSGKQFPGLELVYNSATMSNQTAEQLQKMWKDNLGISVKLRRIDNQLFSRWLQQGEFDLALASWIADTPDPWNFLQVLTAKAETNYTNWQNRQFDNLMAQTLSTKVLKNRQSNLHQAEKILMGQMPVIPLYYKKIPYRIRPMVRGLVISPLGHVDFKSAWLAAE